MDTCRFAPTTSGRAHPGTLLAGLLAWLDARSRGARIVLRLEDLDRQRCRPEFSQGLIDDLAWFGLDWDNVQHQSDQGQAHAGALDALAAGGVLYPSRLSRAQIAAGGRRAPDGGWAYDNRERGTALPEAGWRSCDLPLRVRLPEGRQRPVDEGGLDLAQDPAAAFGDPVVRNRAGEVAYHLAVVVDDHRAGVTRVVRGRDLASASATQAALRSRLGLPDPVYRHHLLLLEPAATGQEAEKLAKCHGSVAADALRRTLSAADVCGFLAWCASLRPDPGPATPRQLLPNFTWDQVGREDVAVAWDGRRLRRIEVVPGREMGRGV